MSAYHCVPLAESAWPYMVSFFRLCVSAWHLICVHQASSNYGHAIEILWFWMLPYLDDFLFGAKVFNSSRVMAVYLSSAHKSVEKEMNDSRGLWLGPKLMFAVV